MPCPETAYPGALHQEGRGVLRGCVDRFAGIGKLIIRLVARGFTGGHRSFDGIFKPTPLAVTEHALQIPGAASFGDVVCEVFFTLCRGHFQLTTVCSQLTALFFNLALRGCNDHFAGAGKMILDMVSPYFAGRAG